METGLCEYWFGGGGNISIAVLNRVRLHGDECRMAGNPREVDEPKSILTGKEAHSARVEAMIDTSE